MISRTAEYALRATVCLAAADGQPLTTAQLSDATRVSVDYLAKVLRALGRAKLVQSRRGLNGGFTLSSHASAIRALDVINAVDPIERIVSCPLGLEGHSKLCPLHRRLDDAIAMVERAFSETVVADFVSDQRTQSLCQFPRLETEQS